MSKNGLKRHPSAPIGPFTNRAHLSFRHRSQDALRRQIECGVGTDDFGYPNALVQTNKSSSQALMQPPSSHERGRDEDASTARARRGGVHQSNCAQDVHMHGPELPGSSRPRGRTNPFSGHAEGRGASAKIAQVPYLYSTVSTVLNGHRKPLSLRHDERCRPAIPLLSQRSGCHTG